MSFKIEKDVPITPAVLGPKRGTSKYPFERMTVGDSFVVKSSDQKVLNNARAAAHNFGRANRTKFVCRTVPGGMRIWRVAGETVSRAEARAQRIAERSDAS
ncbi:conserved protein of unknown function [Pararobbsia alpina]|uniref:DUF7303 family protein n=1 Tax=Pararobbsia alpina TaxID=621374 RepID=UPI0039A5E16E